MSNYVNDLKMNEDELRVFNFGYVKLSVRDVRVLMEVDQEDYDLLYRRYYELGNSYCKFDVLKKLLEKSDLSMEFLRDYMSEREFDWEQAEDKIERDKKNGYSISTVDLIDELKRIEKTNDIE